MTNPFITFAGGSVAVLLSWFSQNLNLVGTVQLPGWMEWSQAIGGWVAGVAGGLSALISLFLIIRGRVKASRQRRRHSD